MTDHSHAFGDREWLAVGEDCEMRVVVDNELLAGATLDSVNRLASAPLCLVARKVLLRLTVLGARSGASSNGNPPAPESLTVLSAPPMVSASIVAPLGSLTRLAEPVIVSAAQPS